MSAFRCGLDWVLATFLTTNRRKLKGPSLSVAKFLGFAMGIFYFVTGLYGTLTPESHRGVLFGITLALVFIWFPSGKKAPADRVTLWDGFLSLLSLFIAGYFIFNYPLYAYRAGMYTNADILFGWVGILLSLEAARRGTGAPVPLLSILMIVYASRWVGPNLPGLWAHKGYELNRISAFLYTTTEGLFGTVAYTLASYVMPFVIFGSFMAASGVGRFFIDLPYSLFGNRVGGTASVAVITGLLMGMISGSPVASVLTIGAFLLPLMAKAHYEPNTAGGIVSASSSGAMFMPPVMGSAAFFMVEFTGIPYIEICKFAFLPAVLFYLGLLTQVILHAKKNGMVGVPSSELPDWRKVLRKGWYLSLPLFILIALLILDYSPAVSAILSAISCILVSLPRKETRMNVKKLYGALADSSKDIMIIACVCGAIGIVIGIIGLTGLGHKFTSILLDMAGGNLFFTIVLVAVAATVLGMGAPIAAVYIILAVLVPPALMELGVSIASAHMLIMWFSQLSGLTPPVCLVAYAAAAMSGGDPFKTGFASLKYGSLLLLIPLMFVYTHILEVGTVKGMIDLITGFVGVFFFAAFMQGYWVRKNTLVENILFAAGSFMLFTPYISLSIIGLVICSAVWVIQLRSKNRTVSRPA